MGKEQKKQKDGRSKWLPNARLTPEELERFNRLKGKYYVGDFIIKLMDYYECK